jgi:hypothetical protein
MDIEEENITSCERSGTPLCIPISAGLPLDVWTYLLGFLDEDDLKSFHNLAQVHSTLKIAVYRTMARRFK